MDSEFEDPLVEPAAEVPKKREHIGGVLGVFIGLIVLTGALLGLFFVRGGPIDASELLTGILGEEPYAFELEVVEAARLPTSELVIRLEPGESESPEESPGERPVEVVFVRFARPEAALGVFRGEEGNGEGFGGGGGGGGGRGGRRGDRNEEADYGASEQMMRWEKNPDFPWHTTIERDEIAWSRWTADYRIERSFREGGGWADSVRVNLCQKGRSLLMFAQWPDETEVSKDVLRDLLRAIKMLDVEEA